MKKLSVTIFSIIAVVAIVGFLIVSNKEQKQTMYLEASWAEYFEDIDSLCENSDIIAIVKPTSVNKQGSSLGFPTIDFNADVVDLIYGNEELKQVVITQTGGYTDDTIYEIADDPLLEIGQKYLIFGRFNDMGTVTILGGPQGRFLYDDGKLNNLFTVVDKNRSNNLSVNFLSSEINYINKDFSAVRSEINEAIGN